MSDELRANILSGGDRYLELKAHYESPCAKCPYGRETSLGWDCLFDPDVYTWFGIPKDCPKRKQKTEKKVEKKNESRIPEPIRRFEREYRWRRRKSYVWSPETGLQPSD